MTGGNTSFFSQLLSLLNDPAFLGSIGGVFLLLASSLRKKITRWCKKKIEKLSTDINLIEQKKHIIPADYATIGMSIIRKLDDLREDFNCSRAAVVQFRNGSRFTLSSPMFRAYVTYESLRNGVNGMGSYINEILGTQILEFIGPLLSDKVVINGVEEVKSKCPNYNTCGNRQSCVRILSYETQRLPHCKIKTILDNLGISIMYASLLYYDQNPIGVLLINFLAGVDDVKGKMEENLNKFCETALFIQDQIDISKH